MNPLEYALNSLAWSLLGGIVVVTYQRISTWWRDRRDLQHPPPISTGAYFGTVLVLFAIVAVLFSYSGRIAADANKRCQDRINENNVAVANTRNVLQQKLNDAFVNFVDAKARLDAAQKQLLTHEFTQVALGRYLSVLAYTARTERAVHHASAVSKTYVHNHPSIPIATCNGGNTPPPYLSPVPFSTSPSSTPSTKASHS